jgi:hypothetical protein
MINHSIFQRVLLKVCRVRVALVSLNETLKLSTTKISFSKIKLSFDAGTQALVRSGSPNSSLSADDGTSILAICRAVAVVDSATFPFEKDSLKFKVNFIVILNHYNDANAIDCE